MGTGLVASKSTSLVTSSSQDSENVEKLPCEFCEAMIPMYKLLSHQAECVNPSNVRGSGVAERSSSSAYRPYASLRDSTSSRESAALRDTTSLRENSVTRSSSLRASASSSVVNKYLRQSSTSTPSETPTSSLSRYSSNGNNANSDSGMSRKISPTSSIVNRYVSSPEPSSNGSKYMPESPPSFEKITPGTSVYLGRSSFLIEEKRKEQVEKKSETKSYSMKSAAPGMYENDTDRENLRQMLSGLRRDPMDVEEDPDNNDGSFFPCEFCGDPYPSEFIMRHQVSISFIYIKIYVALTFMFF